MPLINTEPGHGPTGYTMKNTNRNTTVMDAAKYFWGKNELEKALKTDREDVQS